MKKLLCTVLALVFVLSLVAGCSNSNGAGATPAPAQTSGNAAPAEPSDNGQAPAGTVAYKIGGTGPLTVGAAIYGNAAKNGAQIAVD